MSIQQIAATPQPASMRGDPLTVADTFIRFPRLLVQFVLSKCYSASPDTVFHVPETIVASYSNSVEKEILQPKHSIFYILPDISVVTQVHFHQERLRSMARSEVLRRYQFLIAPT